MSAVIPTARMEATGGVAGRAGDRLGDRDRQGACREQHARGVTEVEHAWREIIRPALVHPLHHGARCPGRKGADAPGEPLGAQDPDQDGDAKSHRDQEQDRDQKPIAHERAGDGQEEDPQRGRRSLDAWVARPMSVKPSTTA